MPELPEVETVCRGLSPRLVGTTLAGVEVRETRMRWPVPTAQFEKACGEKLVGLRRRSKYLLFDFASGAMIAHLGMTGSFRFVEEGEPWRKHDHAEWLWKAKATSKAKSQASTVRLRYHDPRRFGALLWQPGKAEDHPLLANLGPEPLEKGFTAAHLEEALAGRKAAIKVAIMDASVVVGVGNIYASEACFIAGIKPSTPARKVKGARAQKLVEAIRQVLADAITAGGTTFRDFENANAMPGYFARALNVYGRAGEACGRCGGTIRKAVMGQRSTYWCAGCQK
jgi:formamidopyrimidine-DNA glycosylase